MSARHTPGPWHIHPDHPRAVDASGGVEICVAQFAIRQGGNDVQMVVEAEANARLIAAAPDLLAALENALRWHDQLRPDDVARMRAAIAKAAGP